MELYIRFMGALQNSGFWLVQEGQRKFRALSAGLVSILLTARQPPELAPKDLPQRRLLIVWAPTPVDDIYVFVYLYAYIFVYRYLYTYMDKSLYRYIVHAYLNGLHVVSFD